MNSNSSISLQTITDPSNNLIDACRKGDQRAQLQIYKIYYRLIFNICLKVVADHIKAEEIMQEVILAALEEVRSCPGNTGFSELLSKSLDMNLSAELCRAGSATSDYNV